MKTRPAEPKCPHRKFWNGNECVRENGITDTKTGEITYTLPDLKVEHHLVAINPRFEKLITSLRIAKENEGSLDKFGTVHDDLFNAFRISLKYYRL